MANSSLERASVERPKDKQKSRITNGSALLPGVDGRSPWVRRCKDVIAAHLSDIPEPTAAERSLIRRAAVLTTEADPETLDVYGRTSGNLRRLLEAVGLQRRCKNVGPTLADVIREDWSRS